MLFVEAGEHPVPTRRPIDHSVDSGTRLLTGESPIESSRVDCGSVSECELPQTREVSNAWIRTHQSQCEGSHSIELDSTASRVSDRRSDRCEIWVLQLVDRDCLARWQWKWHGRQRDSHLGVATHQAIVDVQLIR